VIGAGYPDHADGLPQYFQDPGGTTPSAPACAASPAAAACPAHCRPRRVPVWRPASRSRQKLNDDTLLAAVRAAFSHGMALTLIVCGALTLAGAVLVLLLLPAVPRGDHRRADHRRPAGEPDGLALSRTTS
jgi:hypothetical protein